MTVVFFFLPAAQALWFAFLRQDAFGTSSEFAGFDNFRDLFADSHYLASFQSTALFSVLVAVIGLSIALVLATMANRVGLGSTVYKTLLIWPYAVAPVVAGVLWLFMFASPMGVVAWLLRELGLEIDMRQSNHEGHLVDWLHEAQAEGVKAVLLNAGAYTHTSVAIHDAIKSIKVPVIEVHLSNPHKREAFRHHSYVGMAAQGTVCGFGANSYVVALEAAARL